MFEYRPTATVPTFPHSQIMFVKLYIITEYYNFSSENCMKYAKVRFDSFLVLQMMYIVLIFLVLQVLCFQTYWKCAQWEVTVPIKLITFLSEFYGFFLKTFRVFLKIHLKTLGKVLKDLILLFLKQKKDVGVWIPTAT